MFASTILPAMLAMAGGSLAAVFETLAAPQDGWFEDRDSSAFSKRDAGIQLRIQLVHQNMEQFYEKVMNVWQHPNFPCGLPFPGSIS
jgi:hypothetical protein